MRRQAVVGASSGPDPDDEPHVSARGAVGSKDLLRATRSAVRWRVPVSSVGMLGSGTSCTLARTILARSLVTTTAPSIFDSSRSRWALKSTSRWKPPVASCSTTLS